MNRQLKYSKAILKCSFESEILKAVQRVDITVDRDELIRALNYDREQYQKGFDDARKGATPAVRCKNCTHYDLGVCLKIYSDGNVHPEAWQPRRLEDFCSYGERKDEANES